MSNLNKALIIGRLGKDPEIRYMQNGKGVVNFSIATSEKWNDKQGEKQERTEWHNIVAFDKLAEIIAEYLRKGSLIYIEGKLQTRKWQDKNGQDRYTTEIIAQQMQMLGGKSERTQEPKRREPERQSAPADDGGFDDGFDSDIPF